MSNLAIKAAVERTEFRPIIASKNFKSENGWGDWSDWDDSSDHTDWDDQSDGPRD